MTYVVWNHTNHNYVRDMRKGPGNGSFTNKLQYAKQYPTYEAAKGDCCGNESPRRVDEVMRHG